MPATVNIGTLEGLLRWKADDAELNKSLEEVAKKADVSKKQVSQYNKELNHITQSYNRVAASLDPVTANTQKYERAERTLISALKAGIISQDQHNRQLALAKDKYLGVNASTLTWREEMQKLTGAVGILSPRISGLVSTVQGLTGALGGVAQGAQAAGAGASAAAGGAATATTSFAAMGAVIVPLLPLLAALSASVIAIYASVKVFDFLKDAVSKGLDTQQVIEKLNMALRANGSYAEMSAFQLVALAESYELLTGKSKEEIIAAETILSRFDSLNRQVFPEALRVTLAYAKAMGITAEESAKRLGPALDGSVRSLGALKEAGITLTAAQRKVFTALAETGDKAQYTAKLLELLKEKVGDVSDEDENLTRQMNRANIVLEDFGESIANQVIPALEDVFSELITSLGGWDALKAKVNEVGGAIGNFIRTSIYGLAIGFNELAIVIKQYVIPPLQVYLQVISAIGKGVSVLTLNKGALNFYSKLGESAAKFKTDISGNQAAIERLTRGLVEHRVALEGDTNTYIAHGSTVDDIIAKNARLASQIEELNQIFADHALQLDKIHDLRMLAASGPLDISTRLAEEEKINQKYKDRVELLKLQAKWGEDIGKRLFDTQKWLEDLKIKAKIELEIATKLAPIDLTPAIKKQFADLSKISTENLDKVVADEKKISEARQKAADEYNTLISQTEENWREALKTSKQVADEQIALIRATELTIIEKERAIARVREEQYSTYLSQITGFLSYLGDTLGGFFSDIAQLAQSIQGVNSVAQSLGGWSSVAGAFGGTIAAMAALYAYADALITKHKGEKYGTRTDYNVMAGVDLFGFTSQASKELGHQINAILEGLEDALRISAEDLASLEIRISNDGKQTQAWVKGVWIGTFQDTNTAIREALLIAMQDPDSKLRGLSPLMAEGLADWTSPDMEGMFDFLSKLREISDLNLSPSVIQLQQSFLEINRLREALNKLDQSSQTVIDAHNDLTAAQKRLYDQTVNSMLGIDTSAADAIRTLAGFQKGIGDVAGTFEAGIQSTINAIIEQIDALKKAEERTGALGNPEGGGARPREGRGAGTNGDDNDIIRLFSATVEGVETERQKLERELEIWTKKLGDVPKALSDQQIDLGVFTAIEDDLRKSGKYSELIAEMERERVRIKYEELRLQLVTLGAWERWAGVWQDLYNQAMADAGRSGIGRGGRGGGSDKDSVRDFIKDKKFELSLVGLTEYQKTLKELDRQYDDLIKQAGKDKKLKAELLELKQKELRLLEQEQRKNVTEKFREFLGLVTPFDKVRKTSADLIKEIEASPFGNARKAAMIGRVMAETERQLDKLSKEMALGLFGAMLSDMERFGATEEQMAEARRMQAILEHEMRLANFALTIAQLEAEGRLAPEMLQRFRDMFTFLQGVDPTAWIGGGTEEGGEGPRTDLISSYSSLADQSNELYDILKSVQDKLAEWGRDQLSEVLSRAVELTDSFDALMADINKIKALGPAWDYTIQAQEMFAKLTSKFIDDVLGEFEVKGSEIEERLKGIGEKFTDINAALIHLGASQEDLQRAEEARLSAINEALSEYFDSWREFRENQSFESLSGEEQFFSTQEEFRNLFETIRGGDLSRLDEVLPLAERYRQLLRDYTAGEGQRFGEKEINDYLEALEEIIPDFANILAGGNELGSSNNPLYMETGSLASVIEAGTNAINTGNNLALIEHRRSVDELKAVNEKLEGLNNTILDNALISIREVA